MSFLINRTVLECTECYTDRNSIFRSWFWSQSGYYHSWKLSPRVDPTAGEDNQDCLYIPNSHSRHTSKKGSIWAHFCLESSTAAGGREGVRKPQATTETTNRSPPPSFASLGNASAPASLRVARNYKVGGASWISVSTRPRTSHRSPDTNRPQNQG